MFGHLAGTILKLGSYCRGHGLSDHLGIPVSQNPILFIEQQDLIILHTLHLFTQLQQIIHAAIDHHYAYGFGSFQFVNPSGNTK
ncbi:hypothetical protein D3C85_1838660 [compost metagenome]